MEREEKQQNDNDPLFIREAVVRDLLKWNDCVDAMESALVAATTNGNKSADQPYSSQTSRTFTSVPDKGVLLSMPGFIGNYPLSTVTGDQKHSTLSCKLVTAFSGNSKLNPPLPSVLGTIFLFDADSGRLKAIVEATEITAWRTAAVSIVATKHLFYNSRRADTNQTLAICGTGTQGRIHALGMLSCFPGFFTKVNLWNRTKSRAEKLRDELNELFPGVLIEVFDESNVAVNDADVIVAATNSNEALFDKNDLKKHSAHINAVGFGGSHYSELGLNIYQSFPVFIESRVNINELKGIEAFITGEIGEIVSGQRQGKFDGKTVFQSTGNALEDGVMANLIYQKFIRL